MNSKNTKFLITGGHLTPALAVITELKKRGYVKLSWVGHKYNQEGNKEASPEYNVITDLGIPFFDLKTGKIVRQGNILYIIKNYLLLFSGFVSAAGILIKLKPDVIISFGGYLAVPIVVLGKLMHKKVITHEQTIVTGLANKVIAKFADKILISWDASQKYFPVTKTIKTGNPLRREIFIVKESELIKTLNLDLPTLLVYGGNQGANEVNKRIFKIVPQLLNDFNVIHQTGNSSVTNDYQAAQALQDEFKDLNGRYVVRDYIYSEDVGAVLNKADIIVGRAGANTVAEILALGKLAIFIPIPNTSHDEQTKNALMVVDTGLGYHLPQKESLTPETLYQVILLASNQLKAGKGFNNLSLDECRSKARRMINLDAQINFVGEVEKLIHPK